MSYEVSYIKYCTGSYFVIEEHIIGSLFNYASIRQVLDAAANDPKSKMPWSRELSNGSFSINGRNWTRTNDLKTKQAPY